nr:MAG TPA: Protein involved in gliding motility 9 Secretion System Type.5A [Caudoviricetes sp.]DAR60655.1 MAG TPA: Protein involved in gliding motility 9 Secretion System Type.5A [Caudoviricetes sp.]
MKKLISAICVSIVLSACNQQSKTAQAEEPVQSIQAADCTAPMDITVEQYLINLEQAFKAQNVSTKIHNKNIVKTDCGYDLTLVMDFGAIALKLDEQQKIRAISVGYILKTDGEKGQNLVNNAINGLHSIQAVLSLTTTDKLGESEAGKQLFTALTEVVKESNQTGATAQKDVPADGILYSVVFEKETNTIAIIGRKQP